MAIPTDKMLPIHPGEFLREELDELGLSARAFANALGVPHNRIAAILRGQRAVTADTALRLAAYFGTSADVWMNLQQSYDLKQAELEHGREIRATVKASARPKS
ncbi:MAG: HigA family addiction module antitoxin [Gammaproteobacteria bacterium]|nr:HigA family addiction module antitoxin [Gammaproteobacteria bacterium]